jgi:hypothetical protein
MTLFDTTKRLFRRALATAGIRSAAQLVHEEYAEFRRELEGKPQSVFTPHQGAILGTIASLMPPEKFPYWIPNGTAIVVEAVPFLFLEPEEEALSVLAAYYQWRIDPQHARAAYLVPSISAGVERFRSSDLPVLRRGADDINSLTSYAHWLTFVQGETRLVPDEEERAEQRAQRKPAPNRLQHAGSIGVQGRILALYEDEEKDSAIVVHQPKHISKVDIRSGVVRSAGFLPEDLDWFSSAAVLRSASAFAVCPASSEPYVWDVVGQQVVATLPREHFGALHIAAAAASDVLLIGDTSGRIAAWHACTAAQIGALPRDTIQRVFAVGIDTTGRRAVAAGDPGTILIWNLQTSALWVHKRIHVPDASDAAIAPDGRLAVTCGSDETVRIWECDNGTEVACLRRTIDEVRLARFLNDEHLILVLRHDAYDA